MGWQLTTLVHRLARAIRPPADPVTPAATPGDAAGVVVAERLRDLLPAVDRAAYDRLLAEHEDGADVLARTLAATGRLRPVEHLARRWAALGVADRAAVADPVRAMTYVGRQTDPTTCGSAALTMLAATGDPVLALWLVSGWLPPTGRPPELAGATPSSLERLARGPVEHRFAALQRVLKHRTNAGAAVGLPWPAGLGTPPWGAAREARFPGVRYTHRMLDDTDRVDLAAVLDRVRAAVLRGVPVPLYAGGDTSRGWRTALPRHVVLAVAPRPDGLVVWEPSAGRLVPLRTAEVLGGTSGPSPALGGWNHLMWAVLPSD
ncbi:MAG TPA: hypothetical protein VN257_10110 [Actinotalea sp.]|nr:hypothetical protein [Actinotalea sp.]